eukprot:15292883-Alexandrium_andersonii.AAC.1
MQRPEIQRREADKDKQANTAQHGPIPGPSSEDIGTPMVPPLAMEAPREARCLQCQAQLRGGGPDFLGVRACDRTIPRIVDAPPAASRRWIVCLGIGVEIVVNGTPGWRKA